MLEKIPLTKGVSKILALMYPKKYRELNRNNRKGMLHRAATMAQLNIPETFDNSSEELDISKEMNNVFCQFNELKRQNEIESDTSTIRRKLTSQDLVEQIKSGSRTAKQKKSTFLQRKNTEIKGFLFCKKI